MIVDKKGKLFGKINILDLFFVLVFLAVAVFAYFYFFNSPKTANSATFTYTVEVQNKEADYFSHVNIGDPVKSGYTGAPMGTIVGFEKKQAQVITEADGFIAVAEPENRFDGFITIQADAVVSYPDLILDDEPVKIGSEVAMRSPDVAIHGYVIEIDCNIKQIKGEE